jgi:hypothetical protein
VLLSHGVIAAGGGGRSRPLISWQPASVLPSDA